ncbi:hypothetical protein X768_04640 [Mesorhizobium sp. LSJC265A00]|uniref:hypothetical protein n=1 Tax=Mesorhizobium sp. LSJC265A00 TaxID=1287322 RepID=UPI0003CF5DCE|nr:hypothetical protein [Mesorhizobium sp. LSJC265A00]ESX13632.1 hypothetical protein X768_04640 [Mesorhizobium sp. LSJC265A00]
MMQTLSQAELDDAYHLGIFDCDEALAAGVRRRFYHRQEQMIAMGINLVLWNTIRDELHNELAAAFSDCEKRRLGAERYGQLMERLWQRNPEQQPV